MICIVTGSLRDLRGRPIADGRISFERDGVRGQDGSVVVPKLVEVTADAYGVFSVGLYPGLYAATIRDGVRGSERFAVGVPDAPTADLADLVAQMPELTPTVLAQVLAARDEVLAAAAGGVGGPAETGDTLVAKLVALGDNAHPCLADPGLGRGSRDRQRLGGSGAGPHTDDRCGGDHPGHRFCHHGIRDRAGVAHAADGGEYGGTGSVEPLGGARTSGGQPVADPPFPSSCGGSRWWR